MNIQKTIYHGSTFSYIAWLDSCICTEFGIYSFVSWCRIITILFIESVLPTTGILEPWGKPRFGFWIFFDSDNLNSKACFIDWIKTVHKRIVQWIWRGRLWEIPIKRTKMGTKIFNVMSSYKTFMVTWRFSFRIKGKISDLKYR